MYGNHENYLKLPSSYQKDTFKMYVRRRRESRHTPLPKRQTLPLISIKLITTLYSNSYLRQYGCQLMYGNHGKKNSKNPFFLPKNTFKMYVRRRRESHTE